MKKEAVPSLLLNDDSCEGCAVCDECSSKGTDIADECLSSNDVEVSAVENNIDGDNIENNIDSEYNDLEILKDLANQIGDETVQTVVQHVCDNKSIQTDDYPMNCKCKEKKCKNLMDLLQKDSDLSAFTEISFDILKGLSKCIKLLLNKKGHIIERSLCTLEEKIVLTLCKLKLCLSYECLGILFGVSKSTAFNYFIETLPLLAAVLEEAVFIPDKEEILLNTPECFKLYKDVLLVLDCTEIPVDAPHCLQCRIRLWSHYKGKLTLKFLIGTAPSGMICYCSKAYGGKASDKAIFLQSNILDQVQSGQDALMVDRGFLIEDECAKKNIKLYRPPFAESLGQMSIENCTRPRNIASARVHVERVMERLKNFKILKLNFNWEMTRYVDMIMVVICGLVNLGPPILSKIKYIH